MSCQVLYAKYNSTRSPEYRITTEICEDEKGLFVRKRAGEQAAQKHLEAIYENSVGLKNYYRDIEVISVEKANDGLRFPYIKGTTLMDKLDLLPFEKHRFIAQINEQLAKVLAIRDKYVAPFKMTDAFADLFGRIDFDGIPAVSPANLDSLFTNFVENEDGIYCIDCEWVFDFPVPISFIKYRILLYLYVNGIGSIVKGASLEEVLGWFGFSKQECAVFWQMDDAFQLRAHGENRKYIYTDHYRKRSLTVDYFEGELRSKEEVISAQTGIIHANNQQIENLEHLLGDSRKQVSDLQRQNSKKDEKIQNLSEQIQNKEAHIHSLGMQIRDKEVHIQNQDMQIQQLTIDFQTISNAFYWRITKPARVVTDGLKNMIRKNESLYLSLRSAKDTLRRGGAYAKQRRESYLEERNKTYGLDFSLMKEEIERQRSEAFPREITFSIIVPLYNTPEKYLRQMILSVQEQTYGKWELCLADGSDNKHAYVRRICRRLARKDARIRYRKLDKNLGISGNTNACIEMATGDYIALFDHDDMLHPSALYENMKAICEKDADFIYSDESIFHEIPADAFNSHFKSDFGPDTLRSYNYICHLTVFKRSLLEKTGGGFKSQYDGSQDFDMILRLTEQAQHIVHIPKVLYFWRSHQGSVASSVDAKPYTIDAGKAALAEHLERVGLKGKVLDSTFPSTYKVQYDIEGAPLVSIVIPNMDHIDDLKKCIDSIIEKSTWKNLEIVVVENNSQNDATFEYYKSIENGSNIRIVTWEGGFNFSAICNCGAREAKGDYILILNNDIEVITPDWLEQMLMFAQRDDVGAVGAMLYYPDDTIQHAGLIIGIGGSAGHSHKGAHRGDYGYLLRLTLAQDLSGVTGACCMVPRRVWEQVGGLDEDFAVAFNDVDLCLRIRKEGYLIVWTPYAELYHYESKSRGYEDTPEKMKRFEGERERLRARWGDVIDAGDPYYNPHLRLDREDFSFK